MENLDKRKYLLVDDNIVNVMVNKGNSILISPYVGDPLDVELGKLMDFLSMAMESSDITKCIPMIFSFEEMANNIEGK